jgi:hypothetical protein
MQYRVVESHNKDNLALELETLSVKGWEVVSFNVCSLTTGQIFYALVANKGKKERTKEADSGRQVSTMAGSASGKGRGY